MAASDIEYMSDLRAAMSRRPSILANLLLVAVVACFALLVLWAHWAEIDQVSRGEGRVMPSRHVQVVQNLEGGILARLMVAEGDLVEAGQVLMHLDDTLASSDYLESRTKFLGLEATVARLQGEIDAVPPAFPDEIETRLPAVVRAERELYESRALEQAAMLSRLEHQLAQRIHEAAETDARIAQLGTAIALARDELAILGPLVDKGISAPVELIRLKREENQYVGELTVAREAALRLAAAIEETRQEIGAQRAQFRSRALEEQNEARVTMEALRQGLASGDDRLRRTAVRAPVRGTVKQIFVNTIGGVVRPGMDLLEIVPAEESLIIEARIPPADIAFIHPGAEAVVKFTAYDYSIYGTVPATLEHISADTITEEETGKSYYRVRLRARADGLVGQDGAPLPIIPGMTTNVDIITGKRTVLEYVLKPFNKVTGGAFHER